MRTEETANAKTQAEARNLQKLACRVKFICYSTLSGCLGADRALLGSPPPHMPHCVCYSSGGVLRAGWKAVMGAPELPLRVLSPQTSQGRGEMLGAANRVQPRDRGMFFLQLKASAAGMRCCCQRERRQSLSLVPWKP